MDIQAIRKGIKATLESVSGLNVYAGMPANPSTPCVVVIPDPGSDFIDYYPSMGKAMSVLSFELRLMVSTQDIERAYEQMNTYLSAGEGQAKSLVDAFEADKTLNGCCLEASMSVVRDAYGSVPSGSGTLMAASLPLTVYASRTL